MGNITACLSSCTITTADRIRELQTQVGVLEAQNEALTHHMHQMHRALEEPSQLIDDIVRQNNLEWMDDKLEREYLVQVASTINTFFMTLVAV